MAEDPNPLTEPLLDNEEEINVAPDTVGTEPILPTEKIDEVVDAESQPVNESATTTEDQPWERGEVQPSNCRDWPYGLLFHVQFIAVIVVGGIYTKSYIEAKSESDGGSSRRNDTDDGVKEDLDLLSIILPSLVSAGTAVTLVLLAFAILTRIGKQFITCSVWTSALLSFAIGIYALFSGLFLVGMLALFSALIGCCYAIAVRNRIPFAAANLSAGISSIKANGGITLVVIVLGGLMWGWMLLWTISLFGVVDVEVVCDDENFQTKICYAQIEKGGWILPWILFLFWTQQVFKNLVHTTVAGLVGTWFFRPEEANSFCSKGIGCSLYRSLTHSFGSICYGSLLVAILQTLDAMVVSLRAQQEREGNACASCLLCCLDCILSYLKAIIEYFNMWAFVYVGVYGYPFSEAGRRVMTLFQQRGWSVIINDNLISRALALMCFIISLISGMIPMLIFSDSDSVDNPAAYAIGFVIAVLLTVTIMSIIDSAVRTVIVCFAEAPEEFERNHSIHFNEMKEAWHQVYQIAF